MRKAVSMFVALGVCVAASSVFAETIVHFGTIGHFSGPGDLDLSGDIVKAVNFGGEGEDRVVGDVTFKTDIGDPEFPSSRLTVIWPLREFGDTPDDDSLEIISKETRWANTALGEALEANLAVNVGQDYKLQILIAGRNSELRVWDLEIEGQEAVDEITALGLDTDAFDLGRAVVYTHTFTATDTTLNVRMGDLFGETLANSFVRNPVWQGLILEAFPVPAPSTGLAIMLLGSLASFSRRRTQAASRD